MKSSEERAEEIKDGEMLENIGACLYCNDHTKSVLFCFGVLSDFAQFVKTFYLFFSRRMWLSSRLNVGLLLPINRPPLTGLTEADRRPLGFISGAIIAHESETLSFIKNKTLHLKHKGDGEGPRRKNTSWYRNYYVQEENYRVRKLPFEAA